MVFISVLTQLIMVLSPMVLLHMVFQLKFKNEIVYLSYYLIGVFFIQVVSLNEIMYLVCGLMIQFWCLYTMIQEKRMKNLLYILIVLILDNLFVTIAEIFIQKNITQESYDGVIIRFFVLLILIIVNYYLKKKNIRLFTFKIKTQLLHFIVCVLFLMALLLEVIQYIVMEDMNIRFLIILIAFVVSFIVVIYSVSEYYLIVDRKSSQYREELLLQKELNKLQEQYINDKIHNYKDLQMFRHDILGYLNVISNLSNAKEYDKLQKYIGEMKDEMNIQFIRSGNIYIDAIINALLPRMDSSHIVFDFTYEVIGIVIMKNIHISALFHNLLMNAIEAEDKVETNKRILFIVTQVGMALRIQMRNKIPKTKDIRLEYSSKTNKEQHGLGMLSIEKIIEEYNGNLCYEIINEEMNIDIVIPGIVESELS